ncbi:MAG: FAD-dependent thymidylate synthase [candidate division Zixibacteria bacterium]|nr:FAD-dependent thymidylate synthase [candidate division Zixibacteria bacterium]
MENTKGEIKKPSPSADDQEASQAQPIIPDKNIDPELFRPRPCLDRGFVRLVDYMGSDQSIVQAARVSYGRGTKKVSLDRGLIRYLMRHSHTSPFEMVEFKFHVKLPIFVARQWIRHRTANVNEYSGRYSVMEDEFYVPKPGDIHHQSKTNRQGRAEIEPTDDLRHRFNSSLKQTQAGAYREYEEFIQEDIARELARINLPLSLYTQWYWKIDLHNLFHFLRLRLDDHSQYEIRVYGQAIAEIVREIVPNAYEAFEDYQLDSVTFSRVELKYLADKLADVEIDESRAKECGISKREMAELSDKIERIKKLR